MGKKKKKVTNDNRSGATHVRFRNISLKTKQAILEDIAAGLDRYTIAKKHNVSSSEVKRLKKFSTREMMDLRNSEICNDIVLSNNDDIIKPPIGTRYNSIFNAASITQDSRINPDLQKKSIESIIKEVEKEKVKPIEKEVVLTETIKIETDNTTVKHHLGGKIKVSDDNVFNILEELKSQRYSQRKIAEMYGISPSLVGQIKNKQGRFKAIIERYQSTNETTTLIDKPELTTSTKAEILNENNAIEVDTLIAIPTVESIKDSDKINEQASKIILNDNILTKRTKVTTGIRVGMINGRHDMPVDIFIFDNVSESLMVDFPRQYRKAYSRIQEILDSKTSNSTANNLIVYVTGLTSVLASVIRVCLDLKVNLRLLHWNPNRGKYYPQDIFTDFGDDKFIKNLCPPQLENIPCRQLFTCGCTGVDFVKKGYGYQITEIYTKSNKNSGGVDKDITLFTDQDYAWAYYRAACENSTKDVNIILNKVGFDNESMLIVQKTLSKLINTSNN